MPRGKEKLGLSGFPIEIARRVRSALPHFLWLSFVAANHFMLDADSKPGFFKKVAERLIATRKSEQDVAANVTATPIEVSLQVLEDRVLYSAVPVPVDLIVQADAIDDTIADASATLFQPAEPFFILPETEDKWDFHVREGLDDVDHEPHELDAQLSDELSFTSLSEAEEVGVSLAADALQVTNELIVVDRGVNGYQQLVDDVLASGNRDRIFEIIYLDTASSGIDTIHQELSNRVADGAEPFDAMHLISHGSDGTIQLGTDRLSSSNLDQFSESVAGWSAALTINADLLIYGCDVAQSESGKDFIDSLASLTGADVAASDDITGHDSLGGDWDFEYTVGLTESNLAFSQTVQQHWEQSLADHLAAAENGGQVQSIGVDGAGRTTIVTSVDDAGVTDGHDVVMRFTDQFGNVTTDLVVNETLAGEQIHASVAVAENGSKAITWTSVTTTGERAVYAKFYDGSNSVVRGEFRVDVPAAGVEGDDSSIAIDAAGNVVIVWESTTAGVSEILARRYSVDGSEVGGVFNISGSGFAEFEQSANAFVAMNDSGQFVVVWDTHDGSANDESAIYAKTFHADGTAHSTTQQIQGQANYQFIQASTDIDSSGNFVVSFTANDLGGGADLQVRAESRLFDASPVASYSDFVEETDGDQYASSVALLDNGNVRISWEGEGIDQTGQADLQEVYGATVDFATGNILASQASLDVSSIPQRFVNRFHASVTTVNDHSFASAYLNQVIGDDVLFYQGLPASNNNASPTGQDQTLTLPEDGTQSISVSDFGFSDSDGGTFTQLQISRIPQHGSLFLDGVEVTTGQVILPSEIASGELLYVADENYSGQDTLLFFVHDGIDYADSFSTLTLDVQPEVDGLLSSFGTSYTSTSGGIPVNASIEGEQNRPKITALDDGGYVIVWESVDTDLIGDSDGNGDSNDGQQVYLQRFDAANNKVGSEVLVGGNLEGDQTRPSIITLADGSFVIAATTMNDSGEVDIYAQRFDLNGNILLADGTVDATGTATITLAQHSQFNQDFVSLTALRDGGFIATWSTLDTTLETDASFAAVARIFDANGNPGNEFLLNNADIAPDSSGQFSSRIAELNGGAIVATWYDNLSGRVMYRLLDSSGAPLTESQTVSEATGTPEFNPRVASLGNDGFVIVWRNNDATTAGSEILARRFDLDGTPATNPIQVLNPNSTTFHALPEIISLNDGGFIAVWNSINADNHSIGVAGTRFDTDLNPVTDNFTVNTPQYGSQREPALAMLANGELVVTYVSSDGDNNGANFGNGIFVDRLTPTSFTDEDIPVPLKLVFSNIDTDGSEYADDIQLSGMPPGTRVSDGVTTIEITGYSHVAYITGMNMQVEDLTVTPPENFYGDIYMGVTFVVRDSNGTTTTSGAYETRIMAIRVNPVNDVATYDSINTTVDENGTTDIDLASFFAPSNDADNAGINLSVTPTTGYTLDPSAPILDSGGSLEWNNTSGAAGTITFDSADAQFNENPNTDYAGIKAAFDLDGSGGGDLSISGAKAIEVWFRPDVALAQQTLLEFGDANAGWGLYLINDQVELHFRSAASPANVTPYVLIGGQISSSEFNQAVVSFSTDGVLAGDSTRPDVALYVNGERVDLLTDAQFLGNPNLLTGTLNGSLGATTGGFVHATQASYANFTGSIAGFNVFDQAINEIEVQHRFFDVAHGAHIVQVDGQNVDVGAATTLSSGAIVTYNADGTITYDPNGQFEQLDEYDAGNPDSYQSDNFNISVSDGQGDTQTLTVQLTVEGENDAPTLSFSLSDPAPTTASRAGTVVAMAEGADIDTNGEPGLTYSLTGTVTGAFVIDANSGQISISDENVYQNPPGGAHHVTVTVTDLAGESSQSSYTVPIVTLPAGQVTGTIFEDAVGDGSISGDSGVDGVTVYLYRDNGDGLRDTNDLLVATATTTGGGNYVFQGPTITYDDYYVVVNSKDITPANGFNGSFGVGDIWAEQTYTSAGGLYLNESAIETVSTGGALFGGYSGTRSDDASTLAGAEHVSQVTVSGSTDGVADFGFSFNVVTNTLAGGNQDDDAGSAQRTVQGSLRQFIHNANAIDNSDGSDVDNAMRFIARNGANSIDSTWWSIVVSEALPAILDSHTTIDGTVYSADGSGVLDLRTGRSGSITTVGANDSHSFGGFDQPEFEIVADQTVAAGDRVLNGLIFAANADQTTLSDIAVRNLSIHGFGSTSEDSSNIFLAGGGVDSASAYSINNALIENTFVGIAPDESHGTVFRSQGIKIYRANNGVIQDSLIGFQGLSGIHFRTNAADGGASVATGWQILRNEVTDNGASNNEYGGIGLGNSSGTLVRHNLISDNVGFGIDSYFAPGGFSISENTITRNGLGGFDQGGIRLFGDNSVVSENRIVDNVGTGISVIGTAERDSFFAFAGTGNQLTQNQFGNNTGIDIDLVSSISGGQSFSDITVGGTPVVGLDSNGNNSLDFPEFAGTGLEQYWNDNSVGGTLDRSEYNAAQAERMGQGDGASAIDGFNQHSGNQGLDQPDLVSASLFPDRVELEFDIASGVDRVELYDVTVIGPEERVTYVTSLLVSNMTFDSSSGTYRIAVNPPPPVSGQLTAVAFDGTNTSEFGNRMQLNTVPTAQSNTVSTLEDTPRSLTQADFGFTDVEDQSDTSQGSINISSIVGGTVTLNGTNVSLPVTLSRTDLDSLVFIPTPDSNASGAIEFTVTDSDGATDGTTYTLTIHVTPQNDEPTISSPPTFTLQEDTPRVINNFGALLESTGSDPDGDPFNGLQIATTDFDPGVFLYDSTLDVLTINPPADANGTIQLDYTLQFGDDFVTNSVTFNIIAENDAPRTQDDEIRIAEDTPLNLTSLFASMLSNDTDPEGDPLHVVGGSFSSPIHGTLAAHPISGDLIYSPASDSAHTETLTYEVSDGTTSTTSTLRIIVEEQNDAPVLMAPATMSVTENSTTAGVPTATDIEDGSASWVIVGGADATSFVNDSGTLRFVGAPDFENAQDRSGNNVYRVRLAAVDSEGLQSDDQLIQVRVVDLNEAPVALTQQANATLFASGNQTGGSINLNRLIRDFDAGDSLSFSVHRQSDHGSITISPDGRFSYSATGTSPNDRDSFQFIAIDSQGLQSEVVTVQLNLVNATAVSNTNDNEDDNEDTSENNDSNDEQSEGSDESSTTTAIVGQEPGDGNDASQVGDSLVPISTGVNASTDTAIEFNDFDSNETGDFESDSVSAQSSRTYSYVLNNDENQLFNSFSLDRNYRRSVRVAQFDVDVLASAFLDELESSKQQYLHNRLAVGAPEVAASAATLLTMGYLAWNMASGILLSTFMSSLPAWSSFDVLPVIASSAISSDDGESIEQMVDA